ncbi:hypothetical protein [Alteribacillus sp. YIM 98480]|uniref:hypothetical protein n=1 Tax=Alteribacillus sp. YIM 98480 TaxID=2606599 RepID=UPI00131B6361|nr:hypothetical protein [Alteribacillus sp. YIM 98480]
MKKTISCLICCFLVSACNPAQNEQSENTELKTEPSSYEQKKDYQVNDKLKNAANEYEDYLTYFHRSLRQVADEVQRNDINEYWVQKQLNQMLKKTDNITSDAPNAFEPLKEVQLSAAYELKMAKTNASDCFKSNNHCQEMQTHLNNLFYVDKTMDETYKDILFDNGL